MPFGIDSLLSHLLKTISRHSLHSRLGLGKIFANGSATGMLGDLVDGSATIAVGTIKQNISLHKPFDYTVQYMQDEITWIVPVSQETYFSTAIFRSYVLIASAAMHILIASVIYMIARLAVTERDQFKNVIEVVMLLWGMMVSVPLPRPPKTGCIKVLIVMWAFFCLHWYSAFTTKLYSNLTQMKRRNQVTICCTFFSKRK